jgi:hypothetical protein
MKCLFDSNAVLFDEDKNPMGKSKSRDRRRTRNRMFRGHELKALEAY